jgi:hypothetical protein
MPSPRAPETSGAFVTPKPARGMHALPRTAENVCVRSIQIAQKRDGEIGAIELSI